jgi:putative SOS response-associated peptidase YedK
MRPLHDRMPAVLPPSEYDAWLDPARQVPKTIEGLLLLPHAMDDFVAEPVSTIVNSPKNDVPGCVEVVRELF